MKQLSAEQVAKMRPEAREKYEKRLKVVMRNRKILGVTCIVLAIVLVILALSLTVLFNVKTITVNPKSGIYSEAEILSASGIDIGDNIIRTDSENVCSRIEKNLPYILEATLTKKLSGEIIIGVKDTTAAIIIETAQGYAITDANGKVLEIIKEIPKDSKLLLVKANNKPTVALGELLVLGDEEEKELYESLVQSLKDEGLFSKVSLIDIRNKASIVVEYQNRLRLLIGTSEELETKLKSAVEVIKTEDEKDPTTIAEINLTIPKKVFVNSLESLDEPQEEPQESPEETSEESTSAVSEITESDGENATVSDEEATEDESQVADSEDEETYTSDESDE